MKKKISDVQLKAWVRKGEPLSAQAVGGGLYFRIHTSGSPQFYFRYRFGGKAKWYFLGNYPDTTLAQAKDDARECRVNVKKGIDPSLEKARQKAADLAAKTFNEIADDWYEREIASRYQHPEVVERVLRNWLKPKLGKLPIAEISAAHADEALQDIVRGGAPTVANDALRYLNRIFKFAKKRHVIAVNPVADFDPMDAGGAERARTRALSEEELRVLLSAIQKSESFGRVNELAVMLLLVLCVRKMELLAAKWEAFDMDEKVWRLEENKTASAITIPLPDAVIDWLSELKVLACGSEYLFPARKITVQRRFPHVGPDTLNTALHDLEHGLERFSVHDLRRTARTHLARLGVRSEVAERCLNHKLKGIEGVYNQHDYIDERRRALELWAAEIESLSKPNSSVVVGAFG